MTAIELDSKMKTLDNYNSLSSNQVHKSQITERSLSQEKQKYLLNENKKTTII